MFAAGKTAAVSAVGPEPFNYVTMLLHGDGTNGAQNNTFLDSSTNNFTITRNGNTTQGSFSPYGSNWSNYFDGSSYLAISNGGGSALDMGTGNCTIEMWVNPATQTTSFPSMFAPSSAWSTGTFYIRYSNTGYANKFGIYWNSVGDPFFTTSNTYPTNAWYHVALVRNGTTFTLYINGVADGTGTSSASLNLAIGGSVWLGNNGSASCNYTGYLSNVRVVKGTAVYTSNFTPSTTPLTAISGTSLLTCQSNRFIDNSASPLTITTSGTPSVQRFNPFGASTAYSTSVIGGSAYIDNNGYLSCGSQSAYAFGTGDFTINTWIYPTSIPTFVSIMDTRGNGGNAGWALAMDTARTIYLYSAVGFTVVVTSASGAIPLNAWSYITVTRSGTSYTLYINGVSAGTGSGSQNFTHQLLTVGYSGAGGGEYYYGYMSDAQVIKGTAVAPTLPTAPVATSSGTSVLLNMQNAAIFDNAMMNDLETVGDAQISTSVKKYGTGSLSFDGTGDWVRSFDNLPIAFGSGDFTVEGWIYLNNVSSTKGIMYGLGSNSFGLRVGQSYLGNVNGLNISRSGVADLEYCAFTFSTSTWYHIAVVRSGTTIYFFVDGTQQTTQGSGGSSYNFATPTTGFIIGANNDTNERFNGYIDDFRITKGYARYTANFTAPTAAFLDIGP